MKQLCSDKYLKFKDANFIWTEIHSRRVKLRVDVQKEVAGAVLQKSVIIEFVVQNLQCEDCKATYTPHKWNS